ncbi:MAG: aromatic ring-hydroxylating dioxygenase subunit alpha [Candidatus Binataceae bacterium]
MSFGHSGLDGVIGADRVHRAVYTDPDIFETELDRIFGRAWLYVGHESQIPIPGDYITSQLARQPVIMVRHVDGSIRVLHNRCAHHGSILAADRCGHVEKTFTCMYHGWSFRTDGSLAGVPLPQDYEGTKFDPKDPANGLGAAARVHNYRGFVFASLANDGPDFITFAGAALSGFDNMIDRAPDGVEVAGDCFRVVQQSNWKIFLENMFDNVHTCVVHQSPARGAKAAQQRFAQAGGNLSLEIFKMLSHDHAYWRGLEVEAFPYGHCNMSGFVSPRGNDEESRAYEELLRKRHGDEQAEQILSRNIHHTMIYPGAVLQPSFQQLRIVRPLAVNRTQIDIWLFRLKGAPRSTFRKALSYAIAANSPANMVSADDFESYYRVHQGLSSPGSDWVILSREEGRDIVNGEAMRTRTGTSELSQRNQFRAWRRYMLEETGS